MNQFIKYHNKLDKVLALIASGALFIMMVLVFVDVMMRYFFSNPISGTLEFTGEYLMVVIVYFGLSYTLLHKGHVSVDFLESTIPKSLDKVFKVLTNLLALAAFITLGYFNYVQGMEYLANNTTSRGLLNYPLAPALLIISIGIFSFCIRMIIEIILVFTNKDGEN